jgi:hypothetical protein
MYMEILRYHNTSLIRLIDMTKAINKEWAANPDLAKISPEFERCLLSLVIMSQVYLDIFFHLIISQKGFCS